MGFQRDNIPLAGQGQRPCRVWDRVPQKTAQSKINRIRILSYVKIQAEQYLRCPAAERERSVSSGRFALNYKKRLQIEVSFFI